MWPVSLAVNVNANPNYNSNSGTDCPAHNLHYLQAWFGELCFGISSTPHVFLCKGPFVQVLDLPVYLRLASALRLGLRRHAGETYALRERKHLYITGVPRPFRHGEAFGGYCCRERIPALLAAASSNNWVPAWSQPRRPQRKSHYLFNSYRAAYHCPKAGSVALVLGCPIHLCVGLCLRRGARTT